MPYNNNISRRHMQLKAGRSLYARLRLKTVARPFVLLAKTLSAFNGPGTLGATAVHA